MSSDDQRYELVNPKPDESNSFMSRLWEDGRRSGPWYTRRIYQVGMAVAGAVVAALIIWAIVRSSSSSSGGGSTTKSTTAQAPSGGRGGEHADQHRDPEGHAGHAVTEKHEHAVVTERPPPHPPARKNASTDVGKEVNPFLTLYATSVDDSVDPNMFDHCSVPPMTYVETVMNGFHVLHVNRTLSRFYFEDAKEFVCCFAAVTNENVAIAFMRTANETKGFPNECSFFKDTVTLLFEEAALVVCGSAKGDRIDLQKAEYKFIHNLNTEYSDLFDLNLHNRYNWTMRNKTLNDDKLNIYIVGFESEASANMMTKMPQTTQFLRDHDFVQLEKFAKVSLNATVNKIAVTAGVNLLFARLLCNDGTTFSEHFCPMFNNELRDQGYVQQETQQSMRFWELFYPQDADTCRGPSFCMHLMFDDILNVMEKYKKYYLGAVKWMGRIKEKDLKHVAQIDAITRDAFDTFHRNGVLDDSVVIFLSFNNDTEFASPIKPLSERNESFAFISLPQKFKDKYPQDMRNLEANAKKMISPYDLYFTVIDIIKKTTPEGEKNEDFTPCTKCGSLFNPIGFRTCTQAAIPLPFCLV